MLSTVGANETLSRLRGSYDLTCDGSNSLMIGALAKYGRIKVVSDNIFLMSEIMKMSFVIRVIASYRRRGSHTALLTIT